MCHQLEKCVPAHLLYRDDTYMRTHTYMQIAAMWTRSNVCIHTPESTEAKDKQELTESLNLTSKNSWPIPSREIPPFPLIQVF